VRRGRRESPTIAAVLRAGVAVALAGVALGPAAAGAQIYQWTDSAGVLHYTTDVERIPPPHRADARRLDSRPRDESPEAPGALLPISPSGQVLTSVHINGASLVLMVDTGADRTMISPGAFARTGLDASAGRPVRVIGVTGAAAALEVVIDRVEVAGMRLGPAPVVVHDAQVPGVDGFLGRDLLVHFTLTVDAAAGRATLVPR
jgi:predicted aspartyl protease